MFSDGNGGEIQLSATLKSESSVVEVDSENREISEVEEQGRTYTVLDGSAAGKGVVVIWEDETYLFVLSGNISQVSAINIAVSVE
ncbi:hypothetical protein FACS18949_13040 [Clostridia bacterium]|nr:hypothetical protein FACS189425_04280 [Clostridia bacterium]GHV35317.1 hypothetical protein FACS18949_13040 [Clostridia bacterium]